MERGHFRESGQGHAVGRDRHRQMSGRPFQWSPASTKFLRPCELGHSVEASLVETQ